MQSNRDARRSIAASRRVVTIRELAVWLRVHPATLRRAASAGMIPAVKKSGRWRFSQDVVERWLLDQMARLTGRAEPGGWLFDSHLERGSKVNRKK
ncbi:MAG TPA: helix-turn-helix domain-containing protein [Candidatus Binataceae bacterium]